MAQKILDRRSFTSRFSFWERKKYEKSAGGEVKLKERFYMRSHLCCCCHYFSFVRNDLLSFGWWCVYMLISKINWLIRISISYRNIFQHMVLIRGNNTTELKWTKYDNWINEYKKKLQRKMMSKYKEITILYIRKNKKPTEKSAIRSQHQSYIISTVIHDSFSVWAHWNDSVCGRLHQQQQQNAHTQQKTESTTTAINSKNCIYILLITFNYKGHYL